MNNKLNIFQNIVFLITMCLLIIIRFVHQTLSVGVILMYILYIIMIIINSLDIKKNHEILKDKKYLLLFIIICILTDIILLRSIFDTNIITVGFINNFDTYYKMIYLKSNVYLINILLSLLIGYRFIDYINIPKISIEIKFKNKSEK